MDSTISIKKVTHDKHNYPAIKFNPDEDIDMRFVQEAVFALIVTAVAPLTEAHKKLVICSMRENMLNIFNKPEEEVCDFFIKQCNIMNVY